MLALQALAVPGSATWSARGFMGALAEVRVGALEDALAVSARVPLAPGGRPLLPLPYVLGQQATASWLGPGQRRALRAAWRRAGLVEEWRPLAASSSGKGALVVRFDAAAARGPA